LGDKVEKNGMGVACCTYGGEESFIQGFGGESSGKEITLKTGVDGRIILRWIFRKWDGVGMDWIDVA
jgi:hypothetical protein